MPKPTVFISHITEEGEVARDLKNFIEREFLRSVEVFASSHEESIMLGDEWLTAIKASVSKCGLMVVICSPISVTRSWINFEAGAGWVRGIPVVPMCHSGLTPEQLPVPLNTQQGGLIGNPADIQKLFMRVATLAETDAPDSNDADFFDRIHEFETSTRENLLLKDTQFIANLLHNHVDILEFCIYASTRDYEFLNTLDINLSHLDEHNFTFNDIYRLFNVSLVTMADNQHVHQAIHTVVLRLTDNIRFILSNTHLRIAPELEELLNSFLYSLSRVDNWASTITRLQAPQSNPKVLELAINMIKNETLPPTRRPSNMINQFIDYYDSLIFYKTWVIAYKAIINRLTGSLSTNS